MWEKRRHGKSIAVQNPDNAMPPISMSMRGRFSPHGFRPPNPVVDSKRLSHEKLSMQGSLSYALAVRGGLSPPIAALEHCLILLLALRRDGTCNGEKRCGRTWLLTMRACSPRE
jgi:hypothetical protein